MEEVQPRSNHRNLIIDKEGKDEKRDIETNVYDVPFDNFKLIILYYGTTFIFFTTPVSVFRKS